MATISSTETGGAWSSTSTWVGGVVPVLDTDNAIIVSGSTVTADSGFSVGDGTGVALTVNGTLTACGNSTVKGGISIAGGVFNYNCVEETNKELYIETNGLAVAIDVTSNGNGRLNFGHCDVVASETGSVVLTALSNDGGRIHFDHVNVTGFGSGLERWCELRGTHYFGHCHFLECSCMHVRNVPEGSTLEYEYCCFEESTSVDQPSSLILDNYNGPSTTTITGCVFLGYTSFPAMRGATVSGCFFVKNMYGGGNEYPPTAFENNFFWIDQGHRLPYESTKTLILSDKDNPHPLLPVGRSGNNILRNVICQGGLRTSDEGEVMSYISPTSGLNLTIEKFLTLPGHNNTPCTLMFTCAGGPGATISIRNCTGNGWLAAVAEDYAGHEGLVPQIIDNIIWHSEEFDGDIVHDVGSTPAAGLITTADYQATWNITGDSQFGTELYNCDAGVITNTPGVHDIEADPMFYDSTRTIRSYWRNFLGSTGTETQQDAYIKASLSEIWDDTSEFFALDFEAMFDWIWEGWIPQNPLYRTGSSTGGIFGANQDPIPPSVGGAPKGVLAVEIKFEA